MELRRSLVIIFLVISILVFVIGGSSLLPVKELTGAFSLAAFGTSDVANSNSFSLFGFLFIVAIVSVIFLLHMHRIDVTESEKDKHIHNRFEFLRPKREF